MNNSTTNIDASNGSVDLGDGSNLKDSTNNRNSNYEEFLDLRDVEDEEINANLSTNINNGNKSRNEATDYQVDQFLVEEDDEQDHEDNSLSKKSDSAEVDAAVAAVAKIVEQEQNERDISSNAIGKPVKSEVPSNTNVFAEEGLDVGEKKQKKKKSSKGEKANQNDEAEEVKKVTKKRKTTISGEANEENKIVKRQKIVSIKGHNKSTPFTVEEDKLIDSLVESHCNIYSLTLHDFKELIWKNDNKQQKAKTHFWKTLMWEFPKRTRSSLYKHVKRRYNNFKDRGKWSPDEEKQLKNLCVELNNQWSEIGNRLGRMPEDCRDRYRNYLKNAESLALKSKNKWGDDEQQQLSALVDALTLRSFKVYLLLTGTEEAPLKSWCSLLEQVSSFGEKADSEVEVPNNSVTDSKNKALDNLIIDSINFNKQQKNSKELVTLLYPLRDGLLNKEKTSTDFKELTKKLDTSKFLMDINHAINWTFLSDILGNGRSRIQIRYKWKNVIKRRSEALRSSKEWSENNLFRSFCKVMEKVASNFKDGEAYEDELDWYYVYKLWREEIGDELANHLFLFYRCDPLLIRDIYTVLKSKLDSVEESASLKHVMKHLSTVSDSLSPEYSEHEVPTSKTITAVSSDIKVEESPKKLT